MSDFALNSFFYPRPSAVPAITDQEFRLFQALIHRETGIYLSDAKKTLLVARLARRLRELRLESFGAYYRRVVAPNDEEERIRLIDSICTNETRFFREPQQFDFIKRHIIPEWVSQSEVGRRPRRVRVWSAACSTGEEPYSIAMTLLHHLQPSAGWEIEVLATDISTRALDEARAATWGIEKADEIPPEYLKTFMLRGRRSQEGKMMASRDLRDVIRWLRVNLNDETYSVPGRFDMILCRNVLIYFDEASRSRVIARLLGHLSSSGYFFVGQAENLSPAKASIRSIFPNVYRIAGKENQRPL